MNEPEQILMHACEYGEVNRVCDWIYDSCTAYASKRLPLNEVAETAVAMGESICRTLHAEKLMRLNNPEAYFLKSIRNAFDDRQRERRISEINKSIISDISKDNTNATAIS